MAARTASEHRPENLPNHRHATLLLAVPCLAGALGFASLSTVDDADSSCCASSAAPRAALVADATQSARNLVEVASASEQFTTLVAAVRAAGLVDVLSGAGPFTVLAPTDEAFAKLDQGVLASLLKPENRASLAAVLENHVIAGAVPASAVVGLTEVRPLGGQRLAIDVADGEVAIGGANVVATDVEASNGLIHVIDTVLVPNTEDVIGTALADGRFGTLLVGNARVVVSDREAANGVIHVVDTVLIP